MRLNVSPFHDVLHLCCVETSGLCVSTEIPTLRASVPLLRDPLTVGSSWTSCHLKKSPDQVKYMDYFVEAKHAL